MILHRVHGPPGTGKTTFLSRQCQEAAKKYGPQGVVVGSLTKAAAAEVGGRDTGLPPANVGTLHSHAYHALDRPAMAETTKGLTDWNEWVGVPSLRISTTNAVDPENALPEQVHFQDDGSRLLGEVNIMRQRMIPPADWSRELQRFWEKWTAWKAEKRYCDFTELIEKSITDTDELPQKPSVFMLDEAQDMSKLEFTLAKKWGAQCEQVVIVGDQDQNLYQWRGSDPGAFVADDAATVRTLSQSYRVPEAVHTEAVRWIERISDREPIEYEPRKDASGTTVTGSLRREPHTFRDPVSLLRDIQRTIDSGRTVMVLGTCGYMLVPFIGELKDHGIPFWNPYRTKQGAWNPLRGARRLLSFVAPQAEPVGINKMWTWADVHAWLQPMQAKGTIVRGAKTLVENKLVEDRFKESRKDQVVTIKEITDIIVAGDSGNNHTAVLESDIDWWESKLRHDDRKRQQYALTVARRSGFDQLREQPRLVVGTIHSVKGGEADTVYLLPDLSGAAYFNGWRSTGDGRDAIIRQFYVGMTRAKEELVLCEQSQAEAVKW